MLSSKNVTRQQLVTAAVCVCVFVGRLLDTFSECGWNTAVIHGVFFPLCSLFLFCFFFSSIEKLFVQFARSCRLLLRSGELHHLCQNLFFFGLKRANTHEQAELAIHIAFYCIYCTYNASVGRENTEQKRRDFPLPSFIPSLTVPLASFSTCLITLGREQNVYRMTPGHQKLT